VQAQIQSGHFHDADELIEKALDALDEQVTAAAQCRCARQDCSTARLLGFRLHGGFNRGFHGFTAAG